MIDQHISITLIELQVGIALVIILVGLLPAVRKARKVVAKTRYANKLRHQCLSLQRCPDNYRRLPPTDDQFPDP